MEPGRLRRSQAPPRAQPGHMASRHCLVQQVRNLLENSSAKFPETLAGQIEDFILSKRTSAVAKNFGPSFHIAVFMRYKTIIRNVLHFLPSLQDNLHVKHALFSFNLHLIQEKNVG